MQKFRQIGLQHKSSVSDKVAILESYIAPCSFDLSGYTVRKGTWLLALRVMDDDLWKAVESGAITGFSIGGSGNRIPLN
jgi:DNA adenine methylase